MFTILNRWELIPLSADGTKFACNAWLAVCNMQWLYQLNIRIFYSCADSWYEYCNMQELCQGEETKKNAYLPSTRDRRSNTQDLQVGVLF